MVVVAAVERGVAMARGESITPRDLPASVQRLVCQRNGSSAAPSPAGGTLAETVGEAERNYLVGILRENAGNVASSARQAGMSRQGLHKLLKKHNVDAADYRT